MVSVSATCVKVMATTEYVLCTVHAEFSTTCSTRRFPEMAAEVVAGGAAAVPTYDTALTATPIAPAVVSITACWLGWSSTGEVRPARVILELKLTIGDGGADGWADGATEPNGASVGTRDGLGVGTAVGALGTADGL